LGGEARHFPPRSVALAIAKRLSLSVIANEVDNRIGKFSQRPPIRIRETAFGEPPNTARDVYIAEAVHDWAIYLFRDRMGELADVQRTLFHELLHFRLRKHLTLDQFTSQVMRLYSKPRSPISRMMGDVCARS
jgi:hypothetical protein